MARYSVKNTDKVLRKLERIRILLTECAELVPGMHPEARPDFLRDLDLVDLSAALEHDAESNISILGPLARFRAALAAPVSGGRDEPPR